MSQRIWTIARMTWAAGWDVAIAAAFLITWLAPYALDDRMVHKLTFLMLVEFLVVHATGFFNAVAMMGRRRHHRAAMLAGLLAFYALFAAAFSAMYGSAWPFLAFFMVMLPRIPGIVFRPPAEDAQFLLMGNWAAMTALYVLGAFLTVLVAVPPLGITPEVIAAQEFGIGGVWPEEPYRVMAFGTLYFTGQALLLLATEWIGARTLGGIAHHDATAS